jgi:cytoskeleton protein RodZ
MRDKSKTDTPEQALDALLVPNQCLADTRRQKGIEERVAADALKISVARLKSIEAGDYSVFPSETYVRGHLRKYSRFLNIDEEMIVNAYNSAHPPSFDFVNPENNAKEKKGSVASSSKGPRKFALVTFLLIALWIAAFSFFGQSSNTPKAIFSSSNTTPGATVELDSQAQSVEILEGLDIDDYVPQPEGELAADELVVINSKTGAKDTTNKLAESLNTDALDDAINDSLSATFDGNVESYSDVNSADASPSVLNDGEQVSNSNPLTGPNMLVSTVTAAELVKSISSTTAVTADEIEELAAHVLQFNFVNPCWIKVTEADGTVIFVGLKESSTTLNLSGKAPFKIIFGNVDGTSLIYNEEPIVLEPPSNGRPLRLVVGR